MIVEPPGWRTFCTRCGFESRFWEQDQAECMARVHRVYVKHEETVYVEKIQEPRWSQ